MKMAKASETDLTMAMELANFLDSVRHGYMPDTLSADDDINERIDTNDREQYDRLIDGLQDLLKQGSIMRVIFGMAVVCDPSNELIDPEASTLEHHPKRNQMTAALLFTLYHHQGASSNIGQPIRKLLDIGQHARMTDEQIVLAKSFGATQ